MNAPDRLAVFLTRVRQIGAQRGSAPSHRLYEQIKGEFVREFPGATPEQYTAAMREIALACGV